MKRFFLVVLVLFNLQVFAQTSGDFDLSFGNAGKLIIDIGDLDHCEDVKLDTNGNVYFGGYTTTFGSPTNTDFILGKITPLGVIDSSFGVNGFYQGDFPKTNASNIHQVEVLSDGILIYGSGLKFGIVDTQYLFVSKLRFDGTLDTMFADSGTFSGVFLTSYNFPGSMIVQDNGKIIICGSANDTISGQDVPLIGRLKPNGQPDISFGPTGFKYWDMSSPLQDASNVFPNMPEHGSGGFLNNVIVMDNGDYFFSGFYDNGASIHCLMLMIDSTGNFNSNFAASGYQIFQSNPSYSNKIVQSVLYNDEILLGIELEGQPGTADFLIQPIDSLGVFGTSFYTDFYGQDEHLQKMDVMNNRLYLTGYSTLASNVQPGYFSDFYAVAKYDGLGSLNSQFSNNGLLIENFSTSDEAGATSMALMNNKLVLAGYLNNVSGANITDFGFMCFNNNDLVGVTNIEKQSLIEIYPNPVKNKFSIETDYNIKTMNLYTLTGQKVEVKIDGMVLFVEGLKRGVYVLKMTTKEGLQFTKKVVLN